MCMCAGGGGVLFLTKWYIKMFITHIKLIITFLPINFHGKLSETIIYVLNVHLRVALPPHRVPLPGWNLERGLSLMRKGVRNIYILGFWVPKWWGPWI